jgi:membrane-bound lytic murein transglycosylase D
LCIKKKRLESPVPAEETTELQKLEKANELYARLGESRREYQDAIELLREGEEVEEAILQAILDRIKVGAEECSKTEGCDSNRFIIALMDLAAEQSLALKSQSAQIESMLSTPVDDIEEDLEREPGTSPFVSTMPELGETVSLLRGTDLRDIIELNGPVNAALDDWLTWMRPMLMESYVNYHFLRSKIAPIYEEAGLPEALLFAIMATETGGRVHAYSRAGAAGPLQFMRRTGIKYGLRSVDGFDMRLDPAAATKANVAYLNDQFKVLNNNLEKALAAYNGGENRMRRLHRRYKDAGLWDSRVFYRLPRETREYVPRVLPSSSFKRK